MVLVTDVAFDEMGHARAATPVPGGVGIGMIEQLARLLSERCMTLGPVRHATVHVAKPQALPEGRASTRVTLHAQE